MFLAGSRAAPADPVAATIGVLTGTGGGYLGVRMLVGWRNHQPLLPTLVLFIGGIGSLAGGVWFISINRALAGSVRDDLTVGYVFGLAGNMALVLCWRRWSVRAL